MNYDKIGEFISKKRNELGLTQKELANKIGVTDKAISKWERGLGCPDVSLLEILSKELDISILELLKGRKITEEVIPVTALDDYVKDTIDYSKESNKNKFDKWTSNLMVGIILFVGLLLIFLNVNHILYLNRAVKYNAGFEVTDDIKVNLESIKNNIDKIKGDQGKYKDDDYKTIINLLEKSYEENYNAPFGKIGEQQKITLKNIYELDKCSESYSRVFQVYKILADYDNKMTNVLKEYRNELLLINFLGNDALMEPSLSYQYQIFNNSNELTTNDNFFKLTGRIYKYNYNVVNLLKVSETVIEVGDINE